MSIFLYYAYNMVIRGSIQRNLIPMLCSLSLEVLLREREIKFFLSSLSETAEVVKFVLLLPPHLLHGWRPHWQPVKQKHNLGIFGQIFCEGSDFFSSPFFPNFLKRGGLHVTAGENTLSHTGVEQGELRAPELWRHWSDNSSSNKLLLGY